MLFHDFSEALLGDASLVWVELVIGVFKLFSLARDRVLLPDQLDELFLIQFRYKLRHVRW